MEKEWTSLSTQWEKLTLANNFIFYKVMRHHPDACQHLIEILLGIKIEKMEMIGEETMMVDFGAKAIRLDVFVKDSKRMYDVELQIADTKELPERSRYYQGIMDIDSLKSGQQYKELKDSHIIFICMDDIFGKKLPVYTFENICMEDGNTKLMDRTFKHFFIVPNCATMLNEGDAKTFFNYLISEKSADTYTKDLKEYVDDARHNTQWRQQMMTWERQRAYDFEAGRTEGAREKALDSARNLLANGVSPEIVAKSIGLEMEEVLKIQKEVLPDKNTAV